MDQMLSSTEKLLWTALSFILISTILQFPVDVQAQEAGLYMYSSNPDDYDFGWIASGTYKVGTVPSCSYCVNAIFNQTTGTQALDRVVRMYRCDGIQMNEMWAYHEPTKAIVFSNVTQPVLCIDAVTWDTLRLRPCNSSAVTQRWTRDGNRVVSGVEGSSEGSRVLVGSLPHESSDESHYPLRIMNSSTRSVRVSRYTYTDKFTFLSTKSLVDSSTKRFTTGGLLQITNSPLDQIVNGGFESSTVPTGGAFSSVYLIQSTPSYFAFCGWVMDYGPIDYVKREVVLAQEGNYSVHLNTYTNDANWGSISQTSRTEAGKEYNLSFFFRGFPPGTMKIPSRSNWFCSASYNEARLQLQITNAAIGRNTSVGDATGFTTNFTVDPMNEEWQPQIVRFKALTNVTTISFSSLNFNDSCGPMIDNVKLSHSVLQESWKRSIPWVLVGSIGGVLLLAFVVCLLGLVYGRRYCGSKEDYSGLYKTEHARVFSVKEVSISTKRFSSVLGEGAFGTVYKADFPNGTVGAIKVEKLKGLKSSKVLASEELAVLLRVHHRNLVNLIGFCIHRGRHMLVFEYLPNGNLYDRLHESILMPSSAASGRLSMDAVDLDHYYSKVLPWEERVKIASDVAYGLEYLHHEADPPIVHRDVKSQNILLTATDSAKLADFGLSKAAPASAKAFQSVETMVRGSIGYLDPQYFQTGVFSSKSDVYSYGVVLLELISGHQAIYNAASLSSWAAPYMVAPSLYHELVDKKLNGKYEQSELQSLVELSKMCMLEDGRMRPNMRQVVAFLNSNQLVVHGRESSEQVEETVSREAYHKMHPFFLEATGKDFSST